MGQATLPILGAVGATVLTGGVALIPIAAGVAAGFAANQALKTNTPAAPAPVAAPVAAQAAADPNIAAATAKSNADNVEAQRQRALKVNTLMSDPANPTSGVANYG